MLARALPALFSVALACAAAYWVYTTLHSVAQALTHALAVAA
jgi:hypothetical protein